MLCSSHVYVSGILKKKIDSCNLFFQARTNLNTVSTTTTVKTTLQTKKIKSCKARRMGRTATGITSHVMPLPVAITPKGSKYFPFRTFQVASTMVLRTTHCT